jgi:glutamyl-tRNA reductase
MALLACGINHKTAPMAVREKIAFSETIMPHPLVTLVEQTKTKEAAILSTCNRTEIYCVASEPSSIIEWLHNYQQLSAPELASCWYTHCDQSAVRHMLRVASGLDSVVIGEPQILGQLKNAYNLASNAGTLGKQLQHLFQYTFSVAKHVRTETSVGSHPVSVASAAIDLAKHIFADISQINVLLIGAGEIIELAIKHLQAAGVQRFWVANRTLDRAEQLTQRLGGQAITLNDISQLLPEADMVITATASTLPILGKGAVERALKSRKRRIMFMVDLAMPRNIEPEIGALEDVYLYTLDDLQATIQQNLSHRQDAAKHAEILIEEKAEHYMRTLHVLDASPIIRTHREKAEHIRDEELFKILTALRSEQFTPEQALEQLAYKLTNKLLHGPTQALRKALMSIQDN